MKVAKLPNGKVLKFPSEISDDLIDKVVQEAMRDYIALSKHEKEQKDKADGEIKGRHGELLARHDQLLNAMNQVIHSHGVLLNHAIKGHKEIVDSLNAIAKAQSKPRKRRAIRDKEGKLIGAEDYE